MTSSASSGKCHSRFFATALSEMAKFDILMTTLTILRGQAVDLLKWE